MRSTMRLISVGVVVVFLSACGGSKPASPAAPSTPSTPAAPTVTSLAINGLAAIRTGFVSDYTATATLSNGTTQSVNPTWTSSNASVATVDGNGRLSGVSHGSINLAASYQGSNASRAVNVVNDFGGSWSGTYVLRACDQSGAFTSAKWCQGLGGVGSILPIRLSFSQAGSDQSQISGSLTLGTGITGNVTGIVTTDGRLVIGGSFTVTSSGVTFQFTFGGWDTRLISPGQMRGRWAQNQTAIGATGNAYQEVELVTMTQTSSSPVTVMPGASHYTLSWEELFSAMR